MPQRPDDWKRRCTEPQLTAAEQAEITVMVQALLADDELYLFIGQRTLAEHEALVDAERWDVPSYDDLPKWADAMRRWRRAELAAYREWMDAHVQRETDES
jgi:hypothetical protein